MRQIKYRVYLMIVLALVVSALMALASFIATPVTPVKAQEGTAEATEEAMGEAMTPTHKILAVEKTLINEHWQIMQKGYEWAAKRYNVAIDVVSVPTEADTAAQLDGPGQRLRCHRRFTHHPQQPQPRSGQSLRDGHPHRQRR